MVQEHDVCSALPAKRLNPLNDFAFQATFGAKGDETQTLAFLNAVLERTGKGNLATVEILEARDLPAEIVGEKTGRLDVLAKLADGSKVNIEVQNKNEHNMDKRSLFYWGKKYTYDFGEGSKYIDLVPVIAINIVDFEYVPLDDFHTSFHLWEDLHKDFKLTDACEIHFLDMVKFRRLRNRGVAGGFSLENPLHRWLAWCDEKSSAKLVEEVVKMDMAINIAQSQMDLIRRDPAMLRAYEGYEKAQWDWNSGMYWERQEGRKEGQKKGEQKKALEVAKNALKEGASVEFIRKITGLSEEELRSL
jgi:predicted transposase/invertase (TIGR01784 family)